MPTTLTSKGQVTIPKRIRDELHLAPGAPVEFSVNAAGEVVLHRVRPTARRAPRPLRRRAGPRRCPLAHGRSDEAAARG